MTTTVERLPGATIALEISVDSETVERHMDRAVARVSRQVRIPGFRPGKVPRKTLERHVGTGALLQEALQDILPEVYEQALAEHQIEAIDQPEFDLKSTEPLVVTAKVPVKPDVNLGDYQSLRAPFPEVSVPEEDVESTIENLRRQYAVLEPVERAIEWNDHVRADVKVSVEGQREPHEEQDAEFPVRQGSVVSLPGFAERLVGLTAGGPYDIEFSLPDDFQAAELAGKKASYTITIHEVKKEVLPEVDDEFAKSLGEDDIETVEALRARVLSDLREMLERNTRETYHNEVLDLLVTRATLDYPSVLVDREIERLIDRETNHASHSQEGLQRWLEAAGKTLDELQEEMRERADANVRRALVISGLVDAEGIEVTEAQIDEEIDSLVTGSSEENRAAIRGLFDTPDGRVSIKNQLQTRFAIERLEEICRQEAEEGAARRSSRRRRSGDAAEGASPEATAEDAGDAS